MSQRPSSPRALARAVVSGRNTAVSIGVLVLAAALGGCGVPTSSEVQYVGPGPATGPQSPDEGEAPPTADAAATPVELVENFLLAAAGNPETAYERAREFVRTADQQRWRPDRQIRVVRTLGEPVVTDAPNATLVELTVQPVGTLQPSGYLDVDVGTGRETQYDFEVVTEGGLEGNMSGDATRLRLTEPPPVLLLDDAALMNPEYYYPTPIYFWDSEDHNRLVPDLRWLWTAGEPADQHPLNVLTWLIGGPAPARARVKGGCRTVMG